MYRKNIPDINEFLQSVADMYENSARIFMEYIDNSLDSAETLYNPGNVYPYQIEISVRIDPENKTISFLDNCVGMDKGVEDENGNWRDGLLAIVTNIGKSNKKAVSWLNGQFGFGAHAYMACAKKLSILTTRKEMDHCLSIELFAGDLNVQEEKKVPKNKFPYSSGTIVTICGFKKEWWDEITSQVVREEIEKHFEQILARNNLEIKVFYVGEEERCSPFDYSAYPGKKFEKEITQLSREKGTIKTILPLEIPVKIHLKITDDIIPNKRPIFMNKGRRIEEIQVIKSFRNKSKYRTGVWGHQNLTGYIEVAGLIEPKLSRDEFKKSKNRQMIYKEILEVEGELHEALLEMNKRSESAGMGKLEGILSSALSVLAKKESLRFRTQIIEGTDIDLILVENSDLTLEKKGSGGCGGGGGGKRTEETSVHESKEESELKGKERRKSGFNIKLSDLEPPKTIDGTYLRSQFIDGDAIWIYKNHVDFKERVRRSHQGEMKITERLISYLASEVAVHYKDKFFETRGKQPEVQSILNSRKGTFVDFINFCGFVA